MLKAIIADDETKVSLLIQKLVDWKALGIEIVGIAYDGFEAYRLIEELHPDIVVTDIRMPGMDGIEIIQKTREAGIKSSFIIISGYRHFEYAHNALKYGVEDYLLKPINRDELNAALEKVCQRHAAKRLNVADASDFQKLLRRYFVSNLSLGTSDNSEFELQTVSEICQLNFEKGIFRAVMAKIDLGDVLISGNELDISITKVLECMEDLFNQQFEESVCFVRGHSVYGIIKYASELSDKQGFFASAAEEMNKCLPIQSSLVLTLGIGSPKDDFSLIRDSLKEAVECIKCRLALGQGSSIHYGDLNFNAKTLDDILGSDWQRNFSSTLETLDAKAACTQVESYFNLLSENHGSDPRLWYDLCSAVISHSYSVLSIADAKSGEENLAKDLLAKLFDAGTTESVRGIIGEWLKQYIDNSLAVKLQQERRPIRLARQYIKDNYDKQISLEDVATFVHFNPSYLSSLFKTEVGINFNDYLVQVRMDAAKNLLRDSSLNMDCVAQKVGYQNTKYFSRLFTKTVGITPSLYRNLYS